MSTDSKDPAVVEDSMVRSAIQSLGNAGRIGAKAVQAGLSDGIQWTWDLFDKRMKTQVDPGRAGTPPTDPEAQDWKAHALKLLRGTEGFRSVTYDDASKGAAAPTIGYGFNLSSPLSTQSIKAVLGWTDADIAAAKAKKKTMDAGQSEKVLSHIVDTVNSEVTHATGGVALNYRQRAAIVDTAYNVGFPGMRRVYAALKAGDFAAVNREILAIPVQTDAKTKKPLAHVKTRREFAAAQFPTDREEA